MSSQDAYLTVTGMVAGAADFLVRGGYKAVPPERLQPYGFDGGRVFEDAYGVVAVMVYDTWNQLCTSWPDHQGAIVDLLSAYIPSAEAKAWEGYLVLLTPSDVGDDAESDANMIRYDMSRVRKLVGTGSELQSLRDLERVLLPLLPLKPYSAPAGAESALDLLPELLATDTLPEETVRAAIAAFIQARPIVAAMGTVRLFV